MFDEIYNDVKAFLSENDMEATKSKRFSFRKRSEHIWRVFIWAGRLIDGLCDINRDAVLTAALFHDTGYALSLDGSCHAENSAKLFHKYAINKDFDPGQAEFIEYLIRNHSNKYMMYDDNTPPELILLMEADMLDETGALSIVWDSMAEGGQDDQSFIKTYNHIKNYSGKILDTNPMKTDKAKRYWENKQNLMREFIKQLAFDLEIEE